MEAGVARFVESFAEALRILDEDEICQIVAVVEQNL